jgi:tRNA A-37 threonylcarbamoyl transferase component Bud32
MKTLTPPISLDSRLLHLYRPLVRNLVLIIAGTLLLVTTALIYFDERMVNSLTERLTGAGAETVRQQLDDIRITGEEALGTAVGQLSRIELGDRSRREELFFLLQPYFGSYPILDSINFADAAGNEYAILRQGEERLTRFVVGTAPLTANWSRRVDGRVVEEWTREQTVPPADRPWFKGALQREPGEDYWTRPYAFLTTREPGISVSTRSRHAGSDAEFVVSFNFTLSAVSGFTMALRPSEHGVAAVIDDEGRVLGLPADARFEDPTVRGAAILKPIADLELEVLDTAYGARRHRGGGEGIFQFRAPDNSSWWAGFVPVALDRERDLWGVALIPESDLLGGLHRLRNIVIAALGLSGLLLASGVFIASMGRIRRQVSAAMEDLERRLGQYQLQEKIASGGNGTVYRARHALLRRPTAIKLMNPDFSRDEAARRRFEHEVQITSELTHPNTIAVYDYGHTPDGTMYYVMEYLNGRTLDQVLRLSGPLAPGRVIHVLAQIAGSLAEAHRKGLIHRDIKPSNAMLCERGGVFDVIKVVDFGLVTEFSAAQGESSDRGVLIGTPLYMAPEIISDPGRASPASDLYALGAVGYFLLTGRNVFEGENAAEICAKHLDELPEPPSRRAGVPVPGDLEAIILRCLEKDPAARPAGAAEVRDALLACSDAGAWSQDEAGAWWRRYASIEEPDEDVGAVSRAEMLIALDSRAGSAQP